MTDEQRSIFICGAGGAGFWTAVALSRSGILNIKIFDDDDLQGGLGAQRLPIATPTTLKTDLLRGFLRVSFGGDCPVLVNRKFTGKEVRRNDIVLDCSDMSGVQRRAVWVEAQKRGARCIRVSYDGANSTVVVAEGLPLTGDENGAGYASVPSLALSLFTGGCAAEVLTKLVQALDAGQTVGFIEFQISLSDYLSTTPSAAQRTMDAYAADELTT